MKEKILITGGNGLVANELAQLLTVHNFEVCMLSRTNKNNKYKTYLWDVNKQTIDINAFENLSYIFHLAGAGVADKRWTESRKKEILDSRINSTKLIFKTVKDNNISLKGFFAASAVGYYGFGCNEDVLTENSPNGTDFLAQVCKSWEHESLKFSVIGVRTNIFRIGIVLSNKGAALEKMVPIFKLGLGVPIGTGKQFMPWIHINDLCNMFLWSIINPISNGIYNASSNFPVSNLEFSKCLANVLNKPFFLPNVPEFVLKIAMGEMSLMVTTGMKVSSEKIIVEGFEFKYPFLKDALNDLFL